MINIRVNNNPMVILYVKKNKIKILKYIFKIN